MLFPTDANVIANLNNKNTIQVVKAQGLAYGHIINVNKKYFLL